MTNHTSFCWNISNQKQNAIHGPSKRTFFKEKNNSTQIKKERYRFNEVQEFSRQSNDDCQTDEQSPIEPVHLSEIRFECAKQGKLQN